jgi:hypothetical protein
MILNRKFTFALIVIFSNAQKLFGYKLVEQCYQQPPTKTVRLQNGQTASCDDVRIQLANVLAWKDRAKQHPEILSQGYPNNWLY